MTSFSSKQHGSFKSLGNNSLASRDSKVANNSSNNSPDARQMMILEGQEEHEFSSEEGEQEMEKQFRTNLAMIESGRGKKVDISIGSLNRSLKDSIQAKFQPRRAGFSVGVLGR